MVKAHCTGIIAIGRSFVWVEIKLYINFHLHEKNPSTFGNSMVAYDQSFLNDNVKQLPTAIYTVKMVSAG
jgi:hypothetical protein